MRGIGFGHKNDRTFNGDVERLRTRGKKKKKNPQYFSQSFNTISHIIFNIQCIFFFLLFFLFQIELGSSNVRVGSSIFGERAKKGS